MRTQLQVIAKRTMSPTSAHVRFKHADSSDDASEDGFDEEEAPMIEKESNPHSRKGRSVPKMTIAIMSFLLLASLVGNVALLWCLLRGQDLDTISVKHTSEYCEQQRLQSTSCSF